MVAVTLFDKVVAALRPRQASALGREILRPNPLKARSPIQSVGNAYDPIKITRILKRAAMGDHVGLIDWASEMETRDSHYYSQLQTRKNLTALLPWMVEAGDDKEETISRSEKLQRALRYALSSSSIYSILDGIAKPFSVHEVIWDFDPKLGWVVPKKLLWRDQRHFIIDDNTLDTIYLRGKNGEKIPLPPYKFLIYHANVTAGPRFCGGLARVCSALVLFKGFSVRDWMAFSEIYGMPLRIGTHPPGADDEDVDALKRALDDLGSDASVVIPSNLKIEIQKAAQPGSAGSDMNFFRASADYFNKEISKAVNAQTMVSEGGSSYNQAVIHENIQKSIMKSDCLNTSDQIDAQLLSWVLELNGLGQYRDDHRWMLDPSDPEDLVDLSAALVPFIQAGLRVESSEIRDKFGLSHPAAGAEVIEVAESTAESGDETGSGGGGRAPKKDPSSPRQGSSSRARRAKNPGRGPAKIGR